jgi:hypothetical protein
MLLIAAELPNYLPAAANMTADDSKVLLARANSYCLGFIGGIPPVLDWDADQANLKSIVAQAVEILAEGETAQVDETSGNITEAAPTRPGKPADPLKTVDKMLLPYKAAYERQNAVSTDRGFMFLGG